MSIPQLVLLVIGANLAVLFCLPIMLGFLAGLWEKRMVWPYVSSEEQGTAQALDPTDPYAAPGRVQPLDLTDYAIAVNEELQRRRFRPLGHFLNAQGGIYRLCYDFWLSPDRLVLARVGAGKLAGIPLRSTRLYTRLEDGRCLLTIDESKSGDDDPTGQTLQEVLANADFTELTGRHCQRIDEAVSQPLLYSEIDPLADQRAFNVARAATLVERGWAKFLDPQDHWYKYTVKGAFLAASRSSVREWKRAIDQKERQKIRRPGQEGYLPSELRPSARPRWVNRVQFVCWMLLMMGFITSFSGGPARNQAQVAFRTLVPAVGFVGLIVVWVLKQLRRKPSLPGERPANRMARVPAQAATRGRG
jgi:hypothetical protein